MPKRQLFMVMFLALALVAGYIEQLIPINLGIPGVKLGLANIVTMLLLLYSRSTGSLPYF